MAVRTPYGAVRARRVALGTNVFPSLVRRVRPYTVPVYDYALMTEPLTAEQLAVDRLEEPAGARRQRQPVPLLPAHPPTTGSCGAATTRSTRTAAGCAPSTTTARRRTSSSPGTSSPASRSWRASASRHAWGGAIDTCSRFSAFFGTAHQGKVAYAAGYTGLGVGATRFGAEVMLDLLAGERTERTELEMVRSKPLPFPPEPFAWTGHRPHQVVAGPRRRPRRPPQPVAEDHGPAGPGLRQLTAPMSSGVSVTCTAACTCDPIHHRRSGPNPRNARPGLRSLLVRTAVRRSTETGGRS